jgi:thymidylate synthase
MQFSGRILDDLLRKLLPKLLASKVRISPSRGKARELFGVLLELEQPRGRLSRTETRGKPFSCLGEFLWYLSRDNKLEFIRYYIPAYDDETDDGETIHGGYGPRLFSQRGNDQIQNVINTLKASSESRRAVIQLFNAEDIARRHAEVPCTCTIQFVVRQKRLHMLTTMRSNDAYKGLPHDIFCFTMLQEIVARTLGLELGKYKQSVGSLHLYDCDDQAARQYLAEGVQSTVVMPPMPVGDPWPALRKLLDAEHQIRQGVELEANACVTEPYWADLIRLLQIYAATADPARIEALEATMHFDRYAPYIETRKDMKPRVIRPPRQFLLPLL